jgi:hypothetical protein
MMKCFCNDYPKNILLVDAAMAAGGGYAGKFFKYCPWCSLEIERKVPTDVSQGNMSAVLNRKHFN